MDRLEIAVNEARAQIQFLRIALEVFHLNAAARTQEPLAMLNEMKREVLQSPR